MIKEIQAGIVDSVVALDQRKLLAFHTFMCLGIYPSRGTIMTKFNLSEFQVAGIITKLRENNCKYSKKLDRVLHAHLQENV